MLGNYIWLTDKCKKIIHFFVYVRRKICFMLPKKLSRTDLWEDIPSERVVIEDELKLLISVKEER